MCSRDHDIRPHIAAHPGLSVRTAWEERHDRSIDRIDARLAKGRKRRLFSCTARQDRHPAAMSGDVVSAPERHHTSDGDVLMRGLRGTYSLYGRRGWRISLSSDPDPDPSSSRHAGMCFPSHPPRTVVPDLRDGAARVALPRVP